MKYLQYTGLSIEILIKMYTNSCLKQNRTQENYPVYVTFYDVFQIKSLSIKLFPSLIP